jgi:hypothetical protein
VLRKRKVEIAEGKFLDRRRPLTTTFDELAEAYLKYARGNKKSWKRDATSIQKLSGVFGGKRLAEITRRLSSAIRPCARQARPCMATRPLATLNRELACLKHMFNIPRKGLIELKGGMPSENPVSAIAFLDEQNVGDRVLTPEEFQRMVETLPDYLRPGVRCAYHTGRRNGAIWD